MGGRRRGEGGMKMAEFSLVACPATQGTILFHMDPPDCVSNQTPGLCRAALMMQTECVQGLTTRGTCRGTAVDGAHGASLMPRWS